VIYKYTEATHGGQVCDDKEGLVIWGSVVVVSKFLLSVGLDRFLEKNRGFGSFLINTSYFWCLVIQFDFLFLISASLLCNLVIYLFMNLSVILCLSV